MVYCGKPSKGCATCRSRKIRCDQQNPACGQCIKAEKDCPGYRDMLSLAFRNESDAVIEKAKARAAKTRRSPNPRSREPSHARRDGIGKSLDKTAMVSSASASSDPPVVYPTPDVSDISFTNYDTQSFAELYSAATSPGAAIQPSIEERGINYFFKHFVAKDDESLPGQKGAYGPFHYLRVMAVKDGLDGALRASSAATGLACLANVSKSGRLMSCARGKYTSSLRLINTALTSTASSVKDSTLISIIILALFEATAGSFQLSLKAWTEHINGAAELVRLRGRSQFKTPIGMAIFLQATSHLLISSIQRAIRIPASIVELRNEAFGYMRSGSAAHLMATLDEFALLRANIRDGTLNKSPDILNACRTIDGRLAKFCDQPPKGWEYETVCAPSNTDILYDGYYDIYYDQYIVRNWNGLRSTRIYLNQTIRSCLLDELGAEPARLASADYMASLEKCSDNLIRLRDDILHSVPQHLGFVNRKPFQNTTDLMFTPAQPGDSPDIGISFMDMLSDPGPLFFEPPSGHEPPALTRDPDFPAIGGWFLLWPLLIAANSPLSTPPIRDYIKKILHYINEELGISQAQNIAIFMDRTGRDRASGVQL